MFFDKGGDSLKSKITTIIVIIVMLYLTVVVNIGRFSNPKYTETELLLNLPKFIMLNFKGE